MTKQQPSIATITHRYQSDFREEEREGEALSTALLVLAEVRVTVRAVATVLEVVEESVEVVVAVVVVVLVLSEGLKVNISTAALSMMLAAIPPASRTVFLAAVTAATDLATGRVV